MVNPDDNPLYALLEPAPAKPANKAARRPNATETAEEEPAPTQAQAEPPPPLPVFPGPIILSSLPGLRLAAPKDRGDH